MTKDQPDITRLACLYKPKKVAKTDTGKTLLVTFDLADVGGRLECVGYHVQAYEPEHIPGWLSVRDLEEFERLSLQQGGLLPLFALRAAAVREVQFAGLLATVRRKWAEEQRGFLPQTAKSLKASKLPTAMVKNIIAGDKAAIVAMEQAPKRRGRKKAYSLEDLERVADVYRAAFHAGEHPAIAVMEALKTTHSRAIKLIAHARQAGLLGPTRQGMPGGVEP